MSDTASLDQRGGERDKTTVVRERHVGHEGAASVQCHWGPASDLDAIGVEIERM